MMVDMYRYICVFMNFCHILLSMIKTVIYLHGYMVSKKKRSLTATTQECCEQY